MCIPTTSILLLTLVIATIDASISSRPLSLSHSPSHHHRHHRSTRSIQNQAFRPMSIEPASLFFRFKPNDESCGPSEDSGGYMSCSKKDPSEPQKCIQMHELCDDFPDCPHGDDEDPHFCLYKTLEEAELVNIREELRKTERVRNNVAPSSVLRELYSSGKETTTDENGMVRAGVFKVVGPVSKHYKDKGGFNPETDIVYTNEEEEDEEEVVDQRPKPPRVNVTAEWVKNQ